MICRPRFLNNQVLMRSQSRGHSLGLLCNAQALFAKPEQRPLFGLVMQRTGSRRNYDKNKVPRLLLTQGAKFVRSQSRGHSLGLLRNASYPHTSHVLVVLLGVLSLCRPRFPRLLVFLPCRGVGGIGWSLPPGKTLGDPQEQQPPNATRLFVYRNARIYAQTAGDHPKHEIQPK